MARNKVITLSDAPEINADAVAEDMEARNRMVAIEHAYNDERDLVNQLLGQAQLAGASEEFFRTVRTSKLAYVKENKLYRALSGKKTPHGAEFFGTWEEFCGLLNRSVDQVDRDIANLRAFGEAALESMGKMGIGYREMRQYRKLPEDQKIALIEVAKAGDKDSFLDLAEEIIAKHAKEKDALSAKVEEADANLKAKDKVISKKAEDLSKTQEDLAKLQAKMTRAVERETPDEALQRLREVCNVEEIGVRADVANLRKALQALLSHDADQTQYALGLIAQIERSIIAVKADLGLDDVPLGYTAAEPYWKTPEAQAETDEAIRKLMEKAAHTPGTAAYTTNATNAINTANGVEINPGKAEEI